MKIIKTAQYEKKAEEPSRDPSLLLPYIPKRIKEELQKDSKDSAELAQTFLTLERYRYSLSDATPNREDLEKVIENRQNEILSIPGVRANAFLISEGKNPISNLDTDKIPEYLDRYYRIGEQWAQKGIKQPGFQRSNEEISKNINEKY